LLWWLSEENKVFGEITRAKTFSPFSFFGVVTMTEASEFTVSGFKRHDGLRSDKGKHHNYSGQRKQWNPRPIRRNSKHDLPLSLFLRKSATL
jgi:hypothetical protein